MRPMAPGSGVLAPLALILLLIVVVGVARFERAAR